MARIDPTVPYRTAIAERGKFWSVDRTYLDSIGYPASGEGKYALLTYSINESTSGGGTTGGGGAIEDGINEDIKATVADYTNSNPLATMIVDADGSQIVSFGGGNSGIADGVSSSIVATVADYTNSNPLSTMIVDANGSQILSFGATLSAETGTPTPVADGAEVDLWVDEYGRQVLFGANVPLNALDVNVINDAGLARLDPVYSLSGVSANATGVTTDVSLYHNITIHTISSGVTSGADITVQHSLNNTNWVDLDVNSVISNTVTELTFTGAYKYIRTTSSNWVDGTFSTILYAGN